MTPRRTQRLFAFLVSTSLLWFPCDLRAGEQDELEPDQVAKYERKLQEGAELFQASDFDGARRALESAYEIFPNPAILFSVAGTYRRQGKNDEAVDAYQKFLDACSDECRIENAEQIEIAERTLVELRPPPPKVEPEAPAGPPRTDGWRRLRWAGIGLGSLGLVALGVAGIHQMRASGIEDEIDDELASNGGTWSAALARKEDDGEGIASSARVFGVLGAAAVAVGVGVYAWGFSRRDEVAFTPVVGAEQAGLVLSGTF